MPCAAMGACGQAFKETKHPKIRRIETWWIQPAVDMRGQEECALSVNENFSQRAEAEAGGGDPSSTRSLPPAGRQHFELQTCHVFRIPTFPLK